MFQEVNKIILNKNIPEYSDVPNRKKKLDLTRVIVQVSVTLLTKYMPISNRYIAELSKTIHIWKSTDSKARV